MTVQRSQSSVIRGQQAAYVVQVSTENNGSAANVSVALTAQPSSQKPTFTSGCAKGDGTATCTAGSVSDKKPATLHAQIAVAAGATSVTSVKLTAAASIVSSVKWTPPSAAETVAVTSASAAPAKSSAGPSPQTTLPLGPVPNLNNIASQIIGAGDASGLFPAIGPSASPNSSPESRSQVGKSNSEPVSAASPVALTQAGLTGQLAGLVALALAVMLTVTRLSLGRRSRSRKHGR